MRGILICEPSSTIGQTMAILAASRPIAAEIRPAENAKLMVVSDAACPPAIEQAFAATNDYREIDDSKPTCSPKEFGMGQRPRRR